jgi:LAO/AO transport system kinase
MGACDTVVVVMCPGAGDGIQAMKAGILEVADVLVVNKSDLPGADRLYNDLSEAVHVRAARPSQGGWQVPVVRASAGRAEGIHGDGSVLEAIARHRAHLETMGLEQLRRAKRTDQVRRIVDEELDARVWSRPDLEARVVDALADGATSYQIAEALVSELVQGLIASRSNPETEA